MNKDLYKDNQNNVLTLSDFETFKGETSFSNVSAKFVVTGNETYIIKGKKFLVKEGEYILGNNNQLTEVLIEHKTKGVCVAVSNDIITEIIQNMFENPDLKEFILSDKFLINKYNSQNTLLGHTLQHLSHTLLSETNHLLTTELFYSIGENIVNDQSVIFSQFSKLNYKKQVVNEEVFRSLLNAKYFIEDNFLTPMHLEDIARIASISKYAFIRLFKTTFGFTPYQFILQKRLLYAKELILQGNAIADVVLCTGFADMPSFSKAFKNHFGINPAALKK